MPRKHEVPMLVDLALCSIGEFVTTFGRWCLISKINPKYGHTKFHSMLELMEHLLNLCIPQQLYDKMSIAVLTAIVNLIKETEGTRGFGTWRLAEKTVALRLIEVAVGAHLKAIEFPIWPEIMQRHVFYNKLYDMVGLEILDLGSELPVRRTSDIEKMIISGVSEMPNLVCFILRCMCTDNIILALSQNCKKLQKLNVRGSSSVTERSVDPLLSCKNLRCIRLHRTSMTIPGYANLLLEHLKIEDIGICNEFGYILEHIHQKDIDIKVSFQMKTFKSLNFGTEHLYLLIDMCPYITSLCLRCDEEESPRIGDLTILATLDYLKELKLFSWDFYAHGINTLLEIKGCAIISLHLVNVQEIDLNALILINQYCPDIRDLVFCRCKFLKRAALHSQKLAVRPFQFLEKIECIECANMHLEFLLSHCINIKFINLSPSTGIRDVTMRRILLQNPMSKLEELKMLESHLSMITVRLLMHSCDNLRRLSKLESWKRISHTEINIFREYLKTTNTNLDIGTSKYVNNIIGYVHYLYIK